MGWKEQRVMGLKIDFVERASRPGANVSALCREFGISRQTGHKWLKRFRGHGYDGLEEKSRRPKSAPLATEDDVVINILDARRSHPTWGPRKIVTLLKRQLGEDAPSERTIARVLERFAQIRKRRKYRPLRVIERVPFVTAKASNDIWTVDFKGWWRSLDGERCEPFTVRDAYSRFILTIELIPATIADVKKSMERLFKLYGRPRAIQCDNGSPFFSPRGRGALSKLSAWWIAIGIKIVRSRLGKPQDNGAHERMHKDMAAEVERVPARTRNAQQRACSRWRQDFNHIRPHEALRAKTPSEVYKPTTRVARKRTPQYDSSFIVRRVNKSGTIRIAKADTFISTAMSGYDIGLQYVSGMRYRIWFYEYDLGLVEVQPTVAKLEEMSAIVDDMHA